MPSLWTALPAIIYPNLPLDLIEALTYGREWQLGHDKLPPLPWWMVEIVYRLIGRDIAYYLLAQIVVLACFAFAYMAALPIVGATGALVSILIIDGIHFFNFTTPKFNHDVLQLPFWALAGLSFLRALQTGRLSWWALLGVALGGALVVEIFRGDPGRPARALSPVRCQSAPQPADARAVCRRHDLARDRDAASDLAGAERFSSLRLCRRRAHCRRADFSIISGIRCCFSDRSSARWCRPSSSPRRCSVPVDGKIQFRFFRRHLPHRHAAGLGTDSAAGRLVRC